MGSGNYRVAVIGCGLAGSTMPQSHIEGYVEHPLTRLVGLHDLEPGKAVAAAVRWRLDRRMIFPCLGHLNHIRPHIISICTPEDTHIKIFREIMLSWWPRALFFEKPLAITEQGCEEISEACHRNHIVLAVNHSRAWDSDVKRMKPPELISFGGDQWRNDVHAMHLGLMFGNRFRVEYRPSENGLWADGQAMWGRVRRNVMVKAISDIIRCIETGKEPECDGNDGAAAVEATIAWRDAVCEGSAGERLFVGDASRQT